MASMLVVDVAAPIPIGVRKGSLVLKCFEKSIEQHGKHGAQKRTYPVDPVVAIEAFGSNVRTKRASWIQRAAGVEHACRC